MEIRFTLTEKEHWQAQWLHVRPRPVFAALAILLVLVYLAVTVWVVVDDSGRVSPFFRGGLPLFGGYLVWYVWWTRRRCRRIFRQHKSLSREQRYEFGESGVLFEQAGAHLGRSWSDYVRFKEGPTLFVLYLSDVMFQALPKRAFEGPEAVERFRALLEERIGQGGTAGVGGDDEEGREATPVRDESRPESAKRVVRRFLEEVVNTGDVSALAELVATHCIETDGKVRVPSGVEGMAEHVRAVRAVYPDLHVRIERQVAEGEWVATAIVAEGTHRGEWLGMAPTGQRLVFTGVNLDRVVDGKIVEHGGAANLLEPFLAAGALRPRE